MANKEPKLAEGHAVALQIESWKCEYCNEERVFPNLDALQQHYIAKHLGQYTELHPYWKSKSLYSHAEETSQPSQNASEDTQNAELSVQIGDYHCEICGMRFPTNEELQEHSTSAFEPKNESLELECSYCQRRFSNDRALKQHVNYCSLKQSTEVTTKGTEENNG